MGRSSAAETATKPRAGAETATAPAGGGDRVVLAMNTSMAGNNFSYGPGDTVSVPKKIADRWIEGGTARKTKAGTEAMYEYEPAQPAPKGKAKGKAKAETPDPVDPDEDDEGEDE